MLFPAIVGASMPGDIDEPDPDWIFALVPSNFELEDDEWSDENWRVVEEVLEGFFDETLPRFERSSRTLPRIELSKLNSADIALYFDPNDFFYYLARPSATPI